jgi:hypothetical protein
VAVGTPVAASAATPSAANVLTSGAIPVTTGVAAAGTMWAEIVAGSASAGLGVTDSQGNTWTVLSPSIAASGSATSTTIAYCALTTGLTTSDTVTVTRTPAGSLTVKLYTASGIDPASPINGTPGAGNSITAVTTIAAGSVTPAAGDLVVELGGMGTGYGTPTPGAGYTGLTPAIDSTGGTNPRGMYSQYQLMASGGSISPTYTISSGKAYAAMSVVFKAATAGSLAGAVSGSTTAGGSVTGTASPTRPTLGKVGDSLGFRANGNDAVISRESLTRSRVTMAGYNDTGGSFYWDCLGGRSLTSAPSVISSMVASLKVVDRILLMLVTNDVGARDGSFDATFNSRVDAALNAAIAAGATRIVMFTLAFKSVINNDAVYFNPLLSARVAAAQSANPSISIRLVDWNTRIHTWTDTAGVGSSLIWNSSDSTHMESAGYAFRDFEELAQIGDQPGVQGGTVSGGTVTASVTAGPTGGVTGSTTAGGAVTGVRGLAGDVTAATTAGGTVVAGLGRSGGVSGSTTAGGTVTASLGGQGPAGAIRSGTVSVTAIRSGTVI